MVNNFENLCTIDPLYCLGELVVVEEDNRFVHIGKEGCPCYDTMEGSVLLHNTGRTELGIVDGVFCLNDCIGKCKPWDICFHYPLSGEGEINHRPDSECIEICYE